MATPTPPKTEPATKPLPPWRVKAGRAVPWLLLALFVCVCVQVVLAAFGIFGAPEAIDAHRTFVHAFEMLPIAILVVALLGRDWTAAIAGGALFLLIGFQYGFIRAGSGSVQALHVVNAFLIFGTVLVLASRRLPWTRRA